MLAVVLLIVGLAAGAAAGLCLERWRRGRLRTADRSARRIAFPFTADGLVEPALRAALRIAGAEGATLVPVYLVVVPLRVALDCAMPSEANIAFPLLEAIEHQAARAGVLVDARVERGRTIRHALTALGEHGHYDRMVIAATSGSGDGFAPEDVAWLLSRAPEEILVLRPAPEPDDGGALEARYARVGRRPDRERPAWRRRSTAAAGRGPQEPPPRASASVTNP
jgi:hypothetical protein